MTIWIIYILKTYIIQKMSDRIYDGNTATSQDTQGNILTYIKIIMPNRPYWIIKHKILILAFKHNNLKCTILNRLILNKFSNLKITYHLLLMHREITLNKYKI